MAQTQLATRNNDIGEMFKKMLPAVQSAAPKHMDPDRMIRIALTTVKRNPELLKCEPSSLLGAFMESVQLGLEIDSRGLAYLLPYNDKNHRMPQVQFQVGYKGLISLAMRAGTIKNIYAEVVYESEKDNVNIELGLDRKLTHKIDIAKPRTGDLILVYAVAAFKDGSTHFEYMQKHDIERIKKSSKSAKSQYSPWSQHEAAMWKKSAVKQLCKFLDLSPEVASAIASDSEQDAIRKAAGNNVIDVKASNDLSIYATVKDVDSQIDFAGFNGDESEKESTAEEPKPEKSPELQSKIKEIKEAQSVSQPDMDSALAFSGVSEPDDIVDMVTANQVLRKFNELLDEGGE